MRFWYDFSDDFKNGRPVEVEILHWFTVDGMPKAVVAVLSGDGLDNSNPKWGEILKIGLGRNFFSEPATAAQLRPGTDATEAE